jgi:4'-phosphopantetheinyl transferase
MLFADDWKSDVIAWRRPPGVFDLSTDGVHLWKLDLSAGDETLWLLSDDERERAATFHFDLHRRRYVRGRCNLRRILAKYLDEDPQSIQLRYNEWGKPLLAAGDLHFNLSHCDDLALVAVGRTAVGIDVERIDRPIDHLAVAAKVFSQDDVDRLTSVNPSDRAKLFFARWTSQESLLKALGCGLAGLKQRGAATVLVHSITPETGFIGAVARAI